MPSTERRYVHRIVVPTIVAGAIALVIYLTLYSGATDGVEMDIAAAEATGTQANTPESRAHEVAALEASLGELDQALDSTDLEQLAAPEREAVETRREAAGAQIEVLKNAASANWPAALEKAYTEINAYSKILGETLGTDADVATN